MNIAMLPIVLRALHVRIALGFAIACLAATHPAFAQSSDISVEAKAPDAVYMGDPLALQIVVRGSKQAAPPLLDNIANLTGPPKYLGAQDQSSSFTMIVNGKVTSRNDETMIYQYQLSPAKAGALQIPAIPVTINGQTYHTAPITIQVFVPTADDTSTLEITPEVTEAFVGQPIEVTLVWAIDKPVNLARVSFGFDPDAVELVSPPDPRPAGTRQLRDNKYVDLDFNDTQVVAELGAAAINNQRTPTVTIRQIVIPRKPGRITLGPARIDFRAVVGQRQRRFGDSPWDDLNQYARKSVTAEPQSLSILPLPTAGRPADFSGLVGRYSMIAAANPTDVSVGEPIDLDVTITGPHPLSLVPPLDLRTQWNNDARLRLPREPILPSFEGAAARFTAPIRVRTDNVTELPPLSLSYFDPYDRTYRTARTPPIPLHVRQGTSIGSDEGSDESDDKPSTPPSANLPEGMAPPGAAAPSLHTRPAFLAAFDHWNSPLVLSLAIAPPACLLCAGSIAFIAMQRPARTDAQREARAYRAAKKTLRQSQSATDTTTAFMRYLTSALNLPPESTTPGDLLSTVHERVPEIDTRALADALWPADAKFAQSNTGDASSRTQTNPHALLDALHQALRATFIASPRETASIAALNVRGAA